MRLRSALPPLLAVAILAGLFVSRVGLVLHEFVGHAGVARALGGHITGYHLFFFGGGRISYAFDPPASTRVLLAIALGGIVLEAAMGATLLLLYRRVAKPLASFVAFCFGAGFLLHALFYLVDGTHYGYGDARLVHDSLGPGGRVWLVAAGVSALGPVAFFAGRGFASFVQSWLGPHSRRERIVVFASMVVVAGGVHVGLTRLEAALTPDETYARIFRSEANERATRLASRELAERIAALRDRGGPLPSEIEKERMLEELARRHRPFPLRPVLYALVASMLVLGLLRPRAKARSGVGVPLDWPCAKRMLLATALAMLLVATLRAPL